MIAEQPTAAPVPPSPRNQQAKERKHDNADDPQQARSPRPVRTWNGELRSLDLRMNVIGMFFLTF
jgi:hypothetical protein